MKKVFGIVLALALVLTTVVASAVPAAAVSEGTVEVCLSNPVAKENSHYCISFHNGSTLLEGDFIDLMFPVGTNCSPCCGNLISFQKSLAPPKLDQLCGPCVCPITWTQCDFQPPVIPVTNYTVQCQPTHMRITLGANEEIKKCWWVLIQTCNITNPCSCEHHLEVGTSTHTPVDSNPYTIYCAKIMLNGGVNHATGYDIMNLISIPCHPRDPSIEAVFADLFMAAMIDPDFSFSIWTYDTAAKKWLKYVSDTSFDEIDKVDVCKAYWIKPSDKIPIFIHGDPYPLGQGPPIKCCYPPSWNMVGFVSQDDMLATDYLYYTLLAPMFSQYCVIAIWGWDVVNQVYDPTVWNGSGSAATDPTLLHYHGYWMAFLAECCIIPPMSGGC